MFDTIGGIPMHPLIVHGVVVLVPLAALLVLLAALSQRVRRWAGILTPIVATAALAMVPLATQSGEALEDRVGESPLIEEHAELGETLIYFVLALAVAAWALWFVDRRSRATASGGSGSGSAGSATEGARSPVMLAVMALCVVAVLATTVQVVRIGHSGASSVWGGVGQQVVVDDADADDD